MAGKLERTMWDFTSFIKDSELRNKFDEIYQQVVEENKGNVIAFLPVGNINVETLDISNFDWVEDYEINSGTRKDEEGNEFDTETEYTEHLKRKANEEFKSWKIVEKKDDNKETIHVLLDADDNEYTWNYSEGESLQELKDQKQEWIDEQPEFENLELEYHEIYWNTVWQYNGEVDREIADKVGLGYLEMNNSGDEYIFLLGCGMDLAPKLIAYQALAYGCIDAEWLSYFESSKLEYTKYVMGSRVWKEVIEKLGIESYLTDAQ